MTDTLWLEVDGLTVDVLTGIYSEETHLPQPLRISVRAKLAMADHYDPTTPLSRSKNYMHLKFAATEGIPKDVHFVLIESVADHIIDTLFLQDEKVEAVEVKIVKLAIAEEGEQRQVGDIAAVLGIPEGTVKSRLRTARARLREALR